MNILFVDDQPESKVYPFVEKLQSKNIEFSYLLFTNIFDAKIYLREYIEDIDLAVIDLGLPLDSSMRVESNFSGLELIQYILDENEEIPVVINSTTIIPNEESYMEDWYERGVTLKKVPNLEKDEWIIDYISRKI